MYSWNRALMKAVCTVAAFLYLGNSIGIFLEIDLQHVSRLVPRETKAFKNRSTYKFYSAFI